jgi:thiosulfate dehydrogenase [quinone] large subunit
MTNPLTTKGAQNLSLLLARCALGAVFLLAGWAKFQGGVSHFVSSSATAIPSFLPDYIGRTYLFLVPFAEFLTGLALILGIFARTAAFIMFLMLISFMIAITGFTGDNHAPNFNLVYATLALLLAAHGPGAYTASHIFKGGGGGSGGASKKSAD